MNWSLFFDVFEPVAVSYAIATGLVFGATAVLYISLRFPPKVPISTRLLALIVGGLTVAAGTLFFAGQIVQAIGSHDPLVLRAVARAALWEVFSVSIGLGLGIARSFAHRID